MLRAGVPGFFQRDREPCHASLSCSRTDGSLKAPCTDGAPRDNSTRNDEQLRVTLCGDGISDWAVREWAFIQGVTLRDWLRANGGLLRSGPACGGVLMAWLSTILERILPRLCLGNLQGPKKE